MKAIKTIQFNDPSEYHEMHFKLLNVILPESRKLTNKEVEVLVVVLGLEGDTTRYPFGTTARKIIMERTGVKKSGLSNYIKTLLEKGFIVEDAIGELKINSHFMPGKDTSSYQLTFNLNTENDS